MAPFHGAIGSIDANPMETLQFCSLGLQTRQPLSLSNQAIATDMKTWLMKTEPTTFSIDDLIAAPDQTTCWEGVRNYQARNLLRDDVDVGDQVLFYHSACKEPAVVGLARVTRAGYPDHHAWDRQHHYYDAKSNPDAPTWFMVDLTLDRKFDAPVTLKQLKAEAAKPGSVLADMMLLQKGSRLSVQPVTAAQFKRVVKLAAAKP